MLLRRRRCRIPRRGDDDEVGSGSGRVVAVPQQGVEIRPALDEGVARLHRSVLRTRTDHGLVADAGEAGGEPAPEEWEEDLTDRLRRAPEVRAALERMWPILDGAELVNDLLGFEALIRSASKDVLTPDEQRLLLRDRVPDVEFVVYHGLPHNITDAVPDRCAQELLRFLLARGGG